MRAGRSNEFGGVEQDPVSSGRTEAFSDGVLAIAITLLVLNLSVPVHQPNTLGHHLLELWPAYVSFLASFVYVAVIWLNHHAAFRRIRTVDRALNWANMAVLLGAVVLPFPTAVLSDAFQHANRVDERAAIVLYGGIGMLMSASWLLFFHTLHRRPHLGAEHVDPRSWRRERRRALVGVGGYGAASGTGLLVAPVTSLALYLLLSVFYAATSEGLIS